LLKDFILIKQRNRNDDGVELEDNTDMEGIEYNKDDDIISLQQHLIDQTTDPYVTKIVMLQLKKELKVLLSYQEEKMQCVKSQVKLTMEK
jgi:hypothetical protein